MSMLDDRELLALYNQRVTGLAVAVTSWILYLGQVSKMPDWLATHGMMLGMAGGGFVIFLMAWWQMRKRQQETGNEPKLRAEDGL